MQSAAVTHALRALRIVVLCLPEVHVTMIHEVDRQLSAILPRAFASPKRSSKSTRRRDVTPPRIQRTDSRTGGATAPRQETSVLQAALQVVPRLIRSFCKPGAVRSTRVLFTPHVHTACTSAQLHLLVALSLIYDARHGCTGC